MAETIFQKPLDQEVASINARLGNIEEDVEFLLATGISSGTAADYTVKDMSKYRYIILYMFRYNNINGVVMIPYSHFKLLGVTGFDGIGGSGSVIISNAQGNTGTAKYVSDTKINASVAGSGTYLFIAGKK